MRIQINYNEESGEIVSISKDTSDFNYGNKIVAEAIEVTEDEFDKLTSHLYKKKMAEKKLIIEKREDIVSTERQKELVQKIKDGKILDSERDELLLLLTNQTVLNKIIVE